LPGRNALVTRNGWLCWPRFDSDAFLARSFWLVDAYCMQHRWQDARVLFRRLLDLRNDVGLLSEEYDPGTRRLVGNFPQAFTHVALINSAFNLTKKPRNAALSGYRRTPRPRRFSYLRTKRGQR
jgi:GH15 family glucan-1,4-alpha-glucosidase